MKIKLTEQQIKNVFKHLNEQETPTSDPSVFQKLSKFGEFLNGLNSMDFNGKPMNPGDVEQAVGTDVTSSLHTISNGSEMYHPLGHTSPITSNFGNRSSSVGSSNHRGVDIATPSGSPVYSPLNGTVLDARDTSPNGCGGFVSLDHKTLITKFCHLRKWVVRKGETVKRGQIIGYSGGGANDSSHGTSTGPHLHYEILNMSGIAMNPVNTQSNLA